MTAGRPTLSVVIPYYRGARLIHDAVQSVLSQTVPADEIVICDDGSPDDLAGALGPLRDRVEIARKENGGISSAMNAAARAARGEFLVQLDQDDVFMPRRLEAIAAAARKHPDADVIATDAIVEYDGERVAQISDLHPFQWTDQRRALLTSCFVLWPAIRRSRLLAIGGYDESFQVMQDWECFIRLALSGASIAYVEEPLYRWRLTPGSRSSRDGIANAEALIAMMTKTLTSSELNAEERRIAQDALVSHYRRLALERAHLAVEEGLPGARRRSLRLLTGAGFSRSTRAKAAVGVLSPWLARAFIERRRAVDPGADALAARGF